MCMETATRLIREITGLLHGDREPLVTLLRTGIGLKLDFEPAIDSVGCR